MRKITKTTILLFFVIGSVFAQQEKGIIGYNNWLNNWTEFKPKKINYGEPTQILSGDITSNTKLTKRNIYLLLGDVFVTDSTTLTIEPGTVILGDYKTKGSLIIANGSKIIAEGTQTDPIIFSSNSSNKKKGDWGGLFVLGNAPINNSGSTSAIDYGLKPTSLGSTSYGGDDINSNSGVLRYVRVEYAGKRTKAYGYYNGLTLAGIGKKTIIENVMVSYSAGNSFSILGGNVTLDKLVSFRSSKTDYKFNFGAQVNIFNSLAIRSPYVSSSKGALCMHIESYDDLKEVDFSKKLTAVNAENLTLINVSEDLNSDIKLGLVQEGIYIGKDASFSFNKSVISGFNPAVVLDEKISINNENLEKINFSRTYFNNCNGNIFVDNNSNNEDLESWYGSRAFNNVYSKAPDSETFIDASNSRNPDFRLRINRIIAAADEYKKD